MDKVLHVAVVLLFTKIFRNPSRCVSELRMVIGQYRCVVTALVVIKRDTLKNEDGK